MQRGGWKIWHDQHVNISTWGYLSTIIVWRYLPNICGRFGHILADLAILAVRLYFYFTGVREESRTHVIFSRSSQELYTNKTWRNTSQTDSWATSCVSQPSACVIRRSGNHVSSWLNIRYLLFAYNQPCWLLPTPFSILPFLLSRHFTTPNWMTFIRRIIIERCHILQIVVLLLPPPSPLTTHQRLRFWDFPTSSRRPCTTQRSDEWNLFLFICQIDSFLSGNSR